MYYFEITDGSGELIALERHEAPVWVYVHPRSGRVIRCEPHQALGVVSLNQDLIYQLAGKAELPGATHCARLIAEADYDELMTSQEPTDDWDEEPGIEEDTETMPKSDMQAKILELEASDREQQEMIELILSGATE